MTYQILIRLLSPIVLLFTILDGLKREAGASFLLKRLGFKLPNLQATQQRTWIHCASVGEVRAVEPLIKAMLAKTPALDLIITSNTATANRLITDLFTTQIHNAYCPIDYSSAIRRFLNRCKPTELIIVETEIWPNLYQQCAQNNIPIRIINGRLSDKTLHAPNWLKNSYRQALHNVEQILARSQTDADNFIQLGADTNKVTVLGNLKFAQQQQVTHFENPIGREYLLAASTHDDEELQIVNLWLKLNRPELLVIVPRHPNRSAAIQKQLAKTGCNYSTASKQQPINPNTQVYLDDRIGFLMPLYQHAKLVIMGGSFVAKGGHNIIEPALYKKPILTGSDYRNFQEEVSLLIAHKGAIVCCDYNELSYHVSALLKDSQAAKTLGENAFKAVNTQNQILSDYLTSLNSL